MTTSRPWLPRKSFGSIANKASKKKSPSDIAAAAAMAEYPNDEVMRIVFEMTVWDEIREIGKSIERKQKEAIKTVLDL